MTTSGIDSRWQIREYDIAKRKWVQLSEADDTNKDGLSDTATDSIELEINLDRLPQSESSIVLATRVQNADFVQAGHASRDTLFEWRLQ